MLPIEMLDALKKSVEDISKYNQLIVIGHGGATLWKNVSQNGFKTSDPIDEFAITTTSSFFDNDQNIKDFKFIFPGNNVIPLQSLGRLAGWHHPSLFRIGINEKWGSWFAYRAVILTSSNYTITPKVEGASPCDKCNTKNCISACPADAIYEDGYKFEKCFEYRKHSNSLCKDKCLARISCPVSPEHRYPTEQIKYHYGLSLKALKNM